METKVTFLVDTCILIDFLRGETGIYDFLVNDQMIDLVMSTVTMMELLVGAFNKREIQRIQKAFKKIKTVFINENISKIAQSLIETYTKSHNLQIEDALIAATALAMDVTLITYNKSDFRYIPKVSLF
jgi:predicted nucleic acid-binding protein